jgi:hypothetical protein
MKGKTTQERDGKVFKWIAGKYNVTAWSELIWLREGSCEHRKRGEIS